MVAKVAVQAAVYAIDRLYSYGIPEDCNVVPGMRVQVPFGSGNRSSEGMVAALEEGDGAELKWIDRTLDDGPVLDAAGLRLAAFLRERYFCTFYDAVKAILPAGLWFQTVDRFAICPDCDWRTAIHRQPLAQEVMERLEELGGEADYPWLRRQFLDEEALQSALQYLQKKKLLRNDSELLRRTRDKTERMAYLAVSAEEAMEYANRRRKSAPVQAALLELLCTVGSGSTKDLCYFTGATAATLRRMESMGMISLEEVPVLRRVDIRPAHVEPVVLNEEQQQAYDGICTQWDRPDPGVALLYGVTGSGKTSVYVQLIHRCLAQGKTAMLLVPEIALTPQLVSLFAGHFGDQVAILHSGLRVGERYDEWKRIRDGAARVVVGTRSAVFAPLQLPGLLILDEEQEHTYKSENSPRYHAREVAAYRGHHTGAMVLLGSATPSIETMYLAKVGRIGFYRLKNRYNGKNLPSVEIIDCKEELRRGNGTSISWPLEERIHETLQRGEQTILFLNRRGTSRYVACVECGEAPQCPRCSVHLTYHGANGRLMCHYCGHSEPLMARCPRCGGPLKQMGTGTQKVEEELRQLLPDSEILRMDADTVSAVHSHEQLLERFEREKIPVLVGTQMVAKGLNFENVTLVGVLDADMSLYVDNFRAAETTFSMITQVVGRAGRGALAGTAVIQTMTPQNAVITLAAAQDYDRFYEMEIAMRHLRGCPPFRDLLILTFSGIFAEQVEEAARRFRSLLDRGLQQMQVPAVLLGPAPASVAKVNNRYRYRLTLSVENSRAIRRMTAECMKAFSRDRQNRGVTVFADVNPYG